MGLIILLLRNKHTVTIQENRTSFSKFLNCTFVFSLCTIICCIQPKGECSHVHYNSKGRTTQKKSSPHRTCLKIITCLEQNTGMKFWLDLDWRPLFLRRKLLHFIFFTKVPYRYIQICIIILFQESANIICYLQADFVQFFLFLPVISLIFYKNFFYHDEFFLFNFIKIFSERG